MTSCPKRPTSALQSHEYSATRAGYASKSPLSASIAEQARSISSSCPFKSVAGPAEERDANQADDFLADGARSAQRAPLTNSAMGRAVERCDASAKEMLAAGKSEIGSFAERPQTKFANQCCLWSQGDVAALACHRTVAGTGEIVLIWASLGNCSRKVSTPSPHGYTARG